MKKYFFYSYTTPVGNGQGIIQSMDDGLFSWKEAMRANGAEMVLKSFFEVSDAQAKKLIHELEEHRAGKDARAKGES